MGVVVALPDDWANAVPASRSAAKFVLIMMEEKRAYRMGVSQR
jgi:hypothetical protein